MSDTALLEKASNNASVILGLDQSKISDHLTVVRIYFALNQLYGGDVELMKHWTITHNKHLGYCPIVGIEGDNAEEVLSYLEGNVFV